MKIFSSCLSLILLLSAGYAQNSNPSTNSFFDKSETKTYALKTILVEGEVEEAGPVDLTALPVRSVAIKEMGLDKDERIFKGAFFVSGYSLYDILNSSKVKKSPENPFSAPVDLYAVVQNGAGEKAVFSWGEIYYRNSFDILLTKSISPINPVRAKTRHTVPADPRVICASDLLNLRFISNPSKITVRSFHGPVPKDKPEDIYSPELTIASGSSFTVTDIGSGVEKRAYTDIGYGHGMGFKGAQSVSGYLLKDLIASRLKITPEMIGRWIAVARAKDGYRSVLSVSEIMNRSDNQDVLLLDRKDSPGSGRYTLFPAADFFADRDVRAVERIELMAAD